MFPKTTEPLTPHDDPAIASLLTDAGISWQDKEKADELMRRALELGGSLDLDLQSSAYRFYFYRHEFSRAITHADNVINILKSKLELGGPVETWRNELARNPDDPTVRKLLAAISAKGFILARTGEREAAHKTLKAIEGIHPKDNFASDAMIFFIENPDRDDYAEESE